MVYPEKWNQQLEILLNGLLISYSELKSHEVGNHEFESYINSVKERFVVKWTRVNFKFNKHNYCNNIKGKMKIPEGFKIVKIDKNLFQKISGKVVPKNFWDSPDHFLKEGIGFCLLNEGTVISTCFSSWIVDRNLELGIETNEKFRRQGYGIYPAAALIDYCLENGYEPVWSCNKENISSFKIAQKLGFEVTCYHPHYSLVKNRI
ncbi:MAG: GNAT family N-acetyltransferase [Candidatus Bathyarchaeia archaeon]